jgi:hypothetical protein
VQGIKNATTAEVYQTHARIALEAKDKDEFNRCQSMLTDLYEDSDWNPSRRFKKNRKEFLAYKILYYLYANNWLDLSTLMNDLTPEDKANKGVQHALQVVSAYNTNNFHKFFQLYKSSPNMNAYVVDFFIDPVRTNAFKAMVHCELS